VLVEKVAFYLGYLSSCRLSINRSDGHERPREGSHRCERTPVVSQ